MKFINLNYLVIFIYLISTNFSYSTDRPEIKNLIIYKNKKKIENVEFTNLNGEKLSLIDYSENPKIINFWATWCAPCRKEMPSLNKLKMLNDFIDVDIIPINIGGDTKEKSVKFFKDININNLDIFSGSGEEFSEKFKIRGLPTTILIDKNGYEFARIVGYIDFENESFLDWLINNL
tara:strand:+ start:1319 stop:1849 length:531 start_codon:yes stop_codon:yes gene_type:complete